MAPRYPDWQFSLSALIALVTTTAVCFAAIRCMGIYVVIALGPPFLVATFVVTFMSVGGKVTRHKEKLILSSMYYALAWVIYVIGRSLLQRNISWLWEGFSL